MRAPSKRGVTFQNLQPKCSNPSCPASFNWLDGCRLFRFSRETAVERTPDGSIRGSGNGHRVEHFWLCEKCSHIYTLEYRQDQGVLIRLLWPQLPAAENDMHLL